MSSPDDPDPPPTDAELAAAEALRRALERGTPDALGDPDWQLREAIRAASSPSALSPERHRRILGQALKKTGPGRVIYGIFAAAATAAAAAVALVVQSSARMAPTGTAPVMAISRSTAYLFREGIPPRGGTSDRVDRIAYVRARDLRENRFAHWGVR